MTKTQIRTLAEQYEHLRNECRASGRSVLEASEWLRSVVDGDTYNAIGDYWMANIVWKK